MAQLPQSSLSMAQLPQFFHDVHSNLLLRPLYILPVRHQKNTEACWAFVVVDLLYSAMRLFGYPVPVKGSEQYLLDFVHLLYPHPWNRRPTRRGLPNNFETAFRFVMDCGLLLEEDYPFLGECNYLLRQMNYYPGYRKIYISRTAFRSISYQMPLVDHDHDNICSWLDRMSLGAAMSLPPSFLRQRWHPCSIYSPTQDEFQKVRNALALGRVLPHQMHAIVLVGSGTNTNGKKFYLVKNSWGTGFGWYGFFKLARLPAPFFNDVVAIIESPYILRR